MIRCCLFIMILCFPVALQAMDVSVISAAGVQLPRAHKQAPDFTLRGLDGQKVSLHDFRGRLVLLHFWATWCVPCRHEMPRLQALQQRMAGLPLQIVCINVDRGNKQRVHEFIRDVTPRFQTLLDSQGLVHRQYAVRALPMTYLIDVHGVIIGRIMGERDWTSPQIRNMLHMLLNGEETNAEEQ